MRPPRFGQFASHFLARFLRKAEDASQRHLNSEIAEAGFWRVGLTGEADMTLGEAMGPPRIALVLGAEGEGMRQNTETHCDALARLPISDRIESLNVSNAAAIALYAATVGRA